MISCNLVIFSASGILPGSLSNASNYTHAVVAVRVMPYIHTTHSEFLRQFALVHTALVALFYTRVECAQSEFDDPLAG